MLGKFTKFEISKACKDLGIRNLSLWQRLNSFDNFFAEWAVYELFMNTKVLICNN